MDSTKDFNMSAAVAVPVLSLLTVILCIPPFIWHVKNRNLAASSLVFWITLSNVFNLVNSLIWTDDDLDGWWRGYVLCDIEVKLINAANVGVPACLAAVMRSLALVLDTSKTVVHPTSAQRKRKIAIDTLFCFGAPIYMIIVHYFVQSLRYYIFAVSGCIPGFDNSWPSIALIHIWSPIFSIVNASYSLLVVHRIRKYRKEFAEILQASNSGMTKSRFHRLFLMCLILTVLGLPVQFYILYKNCMYPMIPFSWNRIHGPAWWDIILIPTNGSVTYDRWIQLAVGLTVFVFFGLGHDAMKMYRRWLVKLGFGKLFPSVLHQSERRPSIFSETGSFSSRAYTFVKGKLSRNSVSGSRHTRHESSSTSTISFSPKPEQRPFSPLSMAETAIDSTTHGPSYSSFDEKAMTNTSSAATRPTPMLITPEPAHVTPSRLARFLQHIQVSSPYNGIHAASLCSGAQRHPSVYPTAPAPSTSTDCEMQAPEPRLEGMGMVHTRDYAA